MPLYRAIKDPHGAYPPALNDYLAWSADPASVSAAVVAPTTLVPQLAKVMIPRTVTITNLSVYVQAAGVTMVAGSNRMGIYDSTGALLSQTADIAAWAATAEKKVALAAAQTIIGGNGTFVWFAILASATTVPTLIRSNPQTATSGNLGLAAGRQRSGTLAAVTSGQGLPASFTPSTGITNSANLFVIAAT